MSSSMQFVIHHTGDAAQLARVFREIADRLDAEPITPTEPEPEPEPEAPNE